MFEILTSVSIIMLSIAIVLMIKSVKFLHHRIDLGKDRIESAINRIDYIDDYHKKDILENKNRCESLLLDSVLSSLANFEEWTLVSALDSGNSVEMEYERFGVTIRLTYYALTKKINLNSVVDSYGNVIFATAIYFPNNRNYIASKIVNKNIAKEFYDKAIEIKEGK